MVSGTTRSDGYSQNPKPQRLTVPTLSRLRIGLRCLYAPALCEPMPDRVPSRRWLECEVA
jgi:hypothetical protein